MNDQNTGPERRSSELRDLAEQQLAARPPSEVPCSDDLLHELQVHQIELEMQNETLRQSQVELEQSRDRYVDLYEFAPVGYLSLTPAGLIAKANLSAATLLGVERRQLINSRFDSHVIDADRERWHRVFISAKQNAGRQMLELGLKNDDGALIQVHLDYLRVESEGTPTLLRVALTDISALKQAGDALREADLRKDEFLAMLAHELRNPMAPIRNAAQVLRKLNLDEPQVRWVQEIIERQVAHLSRLVDDLLDVSRFAKGKINLRKSRVELVDLVSQASEAVRQIMVAKGHRFEVRLPEEMIVLKGDQVRLVQVLQNLLDNAAKYTLGGHITLEARQSGQEVEIQVRDDGMGIATEFLPRVFDLFHQAERTLDRSQGGLGIGLTLVQRLVELHGGRVEAHSAGLGLGSSFIVRLPVLAMDTGEAAPEGCARSLDPVPLRLLVVDDDPVVAESMAVFLELEGHQVHSANSGEAALRQYGTVHPQVVLLDIGMPGMDGYEVARRIRREPGGLAVKLLAVSGYGHEEALTRSRQAGFDRHLVKPVAPQTLTALLADIGAAGYAAPSEA